MFVNQRVNRMTNVIPLGMRRFCPKTEKRISSKMLHRISVPHSHSPAEFSQLPGGYVSWLLLLLMRVREKSHKREVGGEAP